MNLGLFFRVYDIKTPYEDINDDARAGGRLAVSYWISRSWRAEVQGDVAQASPTMSRELSTLTAARAAVEVKF